MTYRFVFDEETKMYYIQRKYWIGGWRFLSYTTTSDDTDITTKFRNANQENLLKEVVEYLFRTIPKYIVLIKHPLIIYSEI